jgi:hypothetical protein
MTEKLNNYETQIYEAKLAKIDEYVESGDLDAANEYIESLGDGLSSDAQARLNQAIKNKADNYIAKADEALKSGERQGAYDMAVMAQNLCPNDDEINKKVEYYKEYLPFALYEKDNTLSVKESIKASSSSAIGLSGNHGINFNEDLTANDSSEMNHSIKISYEYERSDARYIVTYNLGGKYNVVSGVGFVPSNYKSAKQEGYFKIYGDGKTLYCSEKFGINVLPKSFKLDVTNVDTLKVEFYGSSYGNVASCGISNFVATKNLPK